MLQISHTTSFSVFLSLRTTPHYSNWSVRYGLCALTPYVFKHFAGELQALSLSSCSIKPSYLSSYFASESPFGTLLLNLCPGLEPRPCPFESHQSLSRLFVTSSLWLNNSKVVCICICIYCIGSLSLASVRASGANESRGAHTGYVEGI